VENSLSGQPGLTNCWNTIFSFSRGTPARTDRVAKFYNLYGTIERVKIIRRRNRRDKPTNGLAATRTKPAPWKWVMVITGEFTLTSLRRRFYWSSFFRSRRPSPSTLDPASTHSLSLYTNDTHAFASPTSEFLNTQTSSEAVYRQLCLDLINSLLERSNTKGQNMYFCFFLTFNIFLGERKR
jgi:hypothetical protein